MTDIKLYQLSASPNCRKVRIALGYKGIPYESVGVDFQKRGNVVEVSGQPLVPVLDNDGQIVFDSSAILRHLDVAFRDTPRLFAETPDEMRLIEHWERFGRGQMSEPTVMVFRQVFAESPDPAILADAGRKYDEAAKVIESRLAESDWLAGDRMTAADATAAPVAWFGVMDDAFVEAMPMAKLFQDTLKLGDELPRTREWIARVLEFERPASAEA